MINEQTYAAALARANACSPTNERDAVLANISAANYQREQDLETDLADLERRDRDRPA